MMRLFPMGVWPIGMWPVGMWPGVDMVGYRIYRGTSIAGIDYVHPFAYVPAGVGRLAIAALGQAEGASWFYAVRAVSSSGVEDSRTDRVVEVRIESGMVTSLRPNRLASASLASALGGTFTITFSYNGVGELATPVALEVAPVVNGAITWSGSQTLAISARNGTIALAGAYPNGTLLRVAVRGVSALGIKGPWRLTNPAVADSQAPSPVSELTAEAI